MSSTVNTILTLLNTGGVVVLFVIIGVSVTKGVYLPRRSHEAIVAALRETIDELRREVSRLEALLGARREGGG